ncbi:hypothetical protein A2U01_0092935, partial [Trifolium medium]|nr:hypothetical protein [Trifolium medium]
KFLNPDVDLITYGMHVNGSIENDRIVIPATLVGSDDEEDDVEVVNEEDHGVEQDEQDDRREE